MSNARAGVTGDTMVLAGIDEAGYGPVLGPFTLGCCAVRVPKPGDGLPDVWNLLKTAVSAKRDRTGRRLHVNDSKKVYSPSLGLKELEKSMLAVRPAASFDAFLAAVDPAAPERSREVPWYAAPSDEPHPHATDAAAVAIAANALKHARESSGVGAFEVGGRVVFEPEYNRLCDTLRNKSAVAQTIVAQLIDGLLQRHASDGLTIVVDRQGGRSHYGDFLRQMFGAWELSVLREDDARADYTLSRGTDSVQITFAEKAETLALPTGLASMTAKYLRERLMGRFNAWWRSHDPSLKPTAGYWTDGHRWLEESHALRDRLGIDQSTLVRRR